MRFFLIPILLAIACSSTKDGAPVDGACSDGKHIQYGAMGCDVAPICVPPSPPDACTAIEFFCGCDGETKTGVCGSTAQSFSYRSKGECPVSEAGVTDSASDAPCAADKVTWYDAPGCSAPAICREPEGPDACDAISYFCDCDGVTREGICGSIPQNFRYVHAGACETTDASPGG